MRRVLDESFMKDVFVGLKAVFNGTLETQNNDYAKVATVINADTPTVNYTWIADLPSMREWIGDRVLNELSAWQYTISKKDWEASIKVQREVLEYDNLGIVKPRIQELARVVGEHYNSTVFKLFEDNGLCYDGANFFGDHTVDIGGATFTFSNQGTNELNEAGYNESVKEMARLAKENGAPLRIRPNLIVVPPELKAKAVELFKNERKANGASNPLFGEVEILVVPELTDEKSWYLLDTTRYVKPFILQVNKEAKFTAMDKLEDESVFMRKEFRYGVDTEDNVGYGFWQLAYKNTIV